MPHPNTPDDRFALLARVRAARFESERPAEIALHAEVNALIAGMMAKSVPLSPVVEALLYLHLSKPVPDVL